MGHALGKTQVVIYLKSEVHQELRRSAVDLGVSVSELVARALSRWSLKKMRRRQMQTDVLKRRDVR